MSQVYFLGYADGEYNGNRYTSVYFAEKLRAGVGYSCYRKSFKGDKESLILLQPGDPVLVAYNRFGGVVSVSPVVA